MTEDNGTADPPSECLVILNPTSGAGSGARLRSEIEAELADRGVRCRIVQTASHGHARELASAAAEAGAPVIVAAGGDGTIHDVSCGLLETGSTAALGVVPIGRGNDFVKALGIPDRTTAYAAIARGVTRAIDAGRVSWDGGAEFFVNGMGTGIDVEVVRQILRARNVPPRLVYIVGLARALFRYRAIPVAVETDGRRIEKPVMTATVTNGSCIGGNFRICPTARPDDALLDLCLIEEVGLAGAARLVPKVLRATHAESPAVTMLRAPWFTIEADQPLVFQLDGELREPSDARRLRAEVLPGALRVLAPALMLFVFFFAMAAVLVSPDGATAQDIPPTVSADTIRTDTLPLMPRPRTVFIKSLLVPGWGQIELGAYKRAGVFFALESASVYMLLKTIFKLDRAQDAEQRAIDTAADSLRLVISGDTAAARRLADPIAFEDAVFANRDVQNARALVDSRQRHRQDWITYLLFFTMLSGVDAYVGAHLQDFPADLSAEARSDRLDLRISIPIGGR